MGGHQDSRIRSAPNSHGRPAAGRHMASPAIGHRSRGPWLRTVAVEHEAGHSVRHGVVDDSSCGDLGQDVINCQSHHAPRSRSADASRPDRPRGAPAEPHPKTPVHPRGHASLISLVLNVSFFAYVFLLLHGTGPLGQVGNPANLLAFHGIILLAKSGSSSKYSAIRRQVREADLIQHILTS
jgi:hypothetical protein